MLQISLICPKCNHPLPDWNPDVDSITCDACETTFSRREGILNFLPEQGQEIKDELTKKRKSHARILNKAAISGNYRSIFDNYFSRMGSANHGQRIFLDAGCGYGFLSFIAANYFDHVIAVDISDEELEFFCRQVKEKGVTNIHIFKASLCNLPFSSNQFHGIVCNQVLEHVNDHSRLIRNLSRVLSPGGTLYLSTPNRYSLKPEVHTHLWGVGYLPRNLGGIYSKLFHRFEMFSDLSLVSIGELNELFSLHFGQTYAFVRSGLHTSLLGRLAEWGWDKKGLQWLARLLVSDIEVVGRKVSMS